MTEQLIHLIYDESQPQRLDKYLVMCFPDLSRARLQGLIKAGQVLVNEKIAHKSGMNVEYGDSLQVTIPPLEETELIPEEIPLDIIFENRDLLVVNKPAGMVVHPAAGHSTGTLVHAALAHAPDIQGIGGQMRPGVVHRLDKNTSGLILLAKNDATHHWLQEQFRLRKVDKTYLTLVDGKPPTPTGRVEAAIGRDVNQRKRMAIVSPGKGREAASEYRILESFPLHSYMEVHPITGRTHQIRLHMAFIGCPVVGDTIYGYRHPSLPLKRHFLHATRLSLCLPGDSEPTTFTAVLPKELEDTLCALRDDRVVAP